MALASQEELNRSADQELDVEPRPYRWSREDYYRMGELGLFAPDSRVELIDGEILQMSPQDSPHSTGIQRASRTLDRSLPSGYHLRLQLPLSIGASSDPEPDVAVVAGEIEDYEDAHPTSAALVVEVSESTLRFDRGRKASLYASAGVADYWIIDLVNHRVEVRRDPVADAAAPFGFRYATVVLVERGGIVAALIAPDKPIEVDTLLPRRRRGSQA